MESHLHNLKVCKTANIKYNLSAEMQDIVFAGKNIEKRADRYGINRIGKESVSYIKISLGFDLSNTSPGA